MAPDDPDGGEQSEAGEERLKADPRPLGLPAELHRRRARQALLGIAPEPLRVGRYALESVLGEGAMGTVFLARDETLEREVALKIIAGERASLSEARALARFSHPNVVQVYEAGESEHGLFIAMERIRGRSLDAWLEGLDRAPDAGARRRRIVALFLEIGAGLAAIHREGLVHRDIKPQNLLVDEEGRPRVVDLGLAAEGAAEGEQAGSVAGTPGYMAPEQRRGEGASPRSDLYGYCLVLREALARASALSAELEGVLARGLRPEPEARWPSMEALLAALEPHARPPASLFRREPLFLARVVVLSALILAPLLLTLEQLEVIPRSGRSWLWLSTGQMLLFAVLFLVERRRFREAVSDRRFFAIPLAVLSLLLSHRLVAFALSAPAAFAFASDFALLTVGGSVIGLLLDRTFLAPASVALLCLITSLLAPDHAPRLWALFICAGPLTVFLWWRRRRAREGAEEALSPPRGAPRAPSQGPARGPSAPSDRSSPP